ncbi:MAG: Bax inhibitor-1/YccA family protein [Candidatus Hydrogenedentota bacterium]
MIRSGNPALNADVFRALSPSRVDETMTLQGTVNKSFILLFCILATATPTWWLFYHGGGGASTLLLMAGAIGGLILALVTIFKKTWAPVTAPLYALAEGCVLGGISAVFEAAYAGIVIQAVMLTFGVLFALLAAYTSGWIRATENFKLGLVAATGGIFLVYMTSMILSFFGMSIPYIHQSGAIGIGFSLVVVVIAALNLVMDFDFIEQGAENNAPKYMEWYGAFGLMVTLIWLYMEILHLLSKLRGRD